MRAFSWRPWIPGTLRLDSISSLFKCAGHSKCDIGTRVGEKDTKMLIFQNNTQDQVRLSMKTPRNHFLTFWNNPGKC